MDLLRVVARLPLPLALLLLLAPLARAPRAAVPAVPGGDVVTRVEAEPLVLLPPTVGWQLIATAGAQAHPDAHRTPRDLPLAGRAQPDVVPQLRRSAPADAARAPVPTFSLHLPRAARAPPVPG